MKGWRTFKALHNRVELLVAGQQGTGGGWSSADCLAAANSASFPAVRNIPEIIGRLRVK